ncbi:DsbA family oxidoreductase [Halalkalibacillus halophilus]|uniref:DsbA family oxidoreductase n=1 Tax=Halalkalibacillus halophilus TaxID=392827 RepID=UPI000427816D|nr:DsbA family oxidoreductase [Halalkalibacillus halophilus]
MKVEIYSDVVCPFCYIGKKRFEQALEKFADKESVESTFRSFQLDPDAAPAPGEDIHAMLAKKYDVPYEKGQEMNRQMAEQGKEVGVEMNFDQVKPANTEDAHRLSQYAEKEGKMDALMERLMQAYFKEGKDVGDHEVLADCAADVGMNREAALEVLKREDYRDAVVHQQQTARQIGVTGVPFFVFNGKYAVSGAQASETFLEILEKVHEEEKAENQLEMINTGAKTEYCEGDDCGDK